MQKPWQKLLVGLGIGAAAVALMLGPSLVFADAYGLDATANAAKIPKTGSVQSIIGNVIGTALSMISVLFFALMLYAGIKWMLARGDSDEAKKALDTIVAAIIGMLIVLGSYAITNFVFGTLGQNTPAASTTPTTPGAAICKADPVYVKSCSDITDLGECAGDDAAQWGCEVQAGKCVSQFVSYCPPLLENECKTSELADGCYWE